MHNKRLFKVDRFCWNWFWEKGILSLVSFHPSFTLLRTDIILRFTSWINFAISKGSKKNMFISMEYDCHIFSKYLVFQMKNISIEIHSISIKTLEFRSKYLVFWIRNFEILGFLHLEFEIVGTSSEIPSISKRCKIPEF